jgi:hypothetical protein
MNQGTELLLRFLNQRRNHVLGILGGLSDDQLRRPVLPPGRSRPGMVRERRTRQPTPASCAPGTRRCAATCPAARRRRATRQLRRCAPSTVLLGTSLAPDMSDPAADGPRAAREEFPYLCEAG